MNSTPNIRFLAVCGILLSGFWAANASGASGSFQQTVSVDGPLVLDVSTGSGSIEIISGFQPGTLHLESYETGTTIYGADFPVKKKSHGVK